MLGRGWVAAWVLGVSASCGFSPETGPLQASACPASTPAAYGSTTAYGGSTSYSGGSGSTSSTATSGAYGSVGTATATGGCAEGGVDSGTNWLVPDGGVTGNVMIADQFNNRVIVVSRTGAIVWSFGDGSSVPGPKSIVVPNDAERLPTGETLITGTGAPAGSEPGCPASGKGCGDNRVIIVNDTSDAIVWQYGESDGAAGDGPGQLWSPATAVLVPTASGDHVLIADQGNARVIEVDRGSMSIVWAFPPNDATAAQTIVAPNSAERLANGDTLIADQGGNRVIEVSTAGDIVWQYPASPNTADLDAPAFASRLSTGNTLITDSNNNRIVEVGAAPATLVWTYYTEGRTSRGNPVPTRAVRLMNGHTLITETLDDQVVEIDEEQFVVYTHGQLGGAGTSTNLLNQPYDAKVVGDYTGLTSPTL